MSFNLGLVMIYDINACFNVVWEWDFYQFIWLIQIYLQYSKPPQTMFVNIGIFNRSQLAVAKHFFWKDPIGIIDKIHKTVQHSLCTLLNTLHTLSYKQAIFSLHFFVNPAIVIYSRNNFLVLHCLAQCGNYSMS